MQKIKLSQLFRLLICFLMLSSICILKDAQWLGYEIKPTNQTATEEEETIIKQADGSIVISTQTIASDIKGYGGATPLKITIIDGKINQIQALKNAETPDFFEQVEKELLPKWIGQNINDAPSVEIDGVSGATLSSTAVNSTIRRAMQTVANLPVEKASSLSFESITSIKWLATLLIVLMGAIVPLFYKNKRYRMIQLCLNIIVLGCWSGTFISHSLIINYLSNGANILRSSIPLLLLIIAFVYPLLGQKKHYCMWLCPLGSLQELAGKSVSKKWKMTPRTIKYLKLFHEGLWALLMILMWSGVCFSWMDYELFTAFLLGNASIFVIIAAILFIILSLFVNRPYCRFVCPTGCLFHVAVNTEDTDKNNLQHNNKSSKL